MPAERGIVSGFSAAVTREKAQAICGDDFIDLRIAEGDLFGWFFMLQSIGRPPRPDRIPTAEQRAMRRETGNRWRAEDRPIFLGDSWNAGPLVCGCIVGGRYYFQTCADGDISPCAFAPIACSNVLDILAGHTAHASLGEFIRDNPVFQAGRRGQASIGDRAGPCLLIDHSETFRRILDQPTLRPGRNMPDGDAVGRISQVIDAAAGAWRDQAANLPPFPRQPPIDLGQRSTMLRAQQVESS